MRSGIAQSLVLGGEWEDEALVSERREKGRYSVGSKWGDKDVNKGEGVLTCEED